MSFTRSTTDISVHQKLGDYPNQDNGLSAEELKKRYDLPAETLQKDLNKLEEELEDISGASNVGAQPFSDSDLSENTVQGKLNQLRKDIQNATLGEIPDGTITQGKLNEEYEKTIAKKDNSLQKGLNAERLDGNTVDDILNKLFVTGTFVLKDNTNGISEMNFNLGFTPRAVLIDSGATRWGAAILNFSALVTTEAPVYKYSDSSLGTINALEIVENGFKVRSVPSSCTAYGTGYRYIAFR